MSEELKKKAEGFVIRVFNHPDMYGNVATAAVELYKFLQTEEKSANERSLKRRISEAIKAYGEDAEGSEFLMKLTEIANE